MINIKEYDIMQDRDNDESYSNGCWDLAHDILADKDLTQETLYNYIQDIKECATNTTPLTDIGTWFLDCGKGSTITIHTFDKTYTGTLYTIFTTPNNQTILGADINGKFYHFNLNNIEYFIIEE